MLLNNTKSIFEPQKLQGITKQDFLKVLKSIIDEGGELSWLTTDKHSFEWAEINKDVKKFLQRISSLEFNMVGIAVFYSRTKQMKYVSFEIVKSVK